MREEDNGMQVFGQNLFMASRSLSKDDKWIISRPESPDHNAMEILFTGTETEAQKYADSFGGSYRRRDE